jgi:regulator of cell morphogenesis and NO signaling
LEVLNPGEVFYILDDHDPKPLYYRLLAEVGNEFTWNYEEHGPIWWKVCIQKQAKEKKPTLGELAASDMRKADVLKKLGLDFCCGGKKSLNEACKEKNLNVDEIERKLAQATKALDKNAMFEFNRWSLDFLADYIYNEHHLYWYEEEPAISDLLAKVVAHHGAKHPPLKDVDKAFTVLKKELTEHFHKEERVLFPHIKDLVRAKVTHTPFIPALPDVNTPLHMMTADHEAAGELLAELRRLTNNYSTPATACNSFKLLYHKLKALEEDLHQHIHLENNILFPKTELLHKELVQRHYAS